MKLVIDMKIETIEKLIDYQKTCYLSSVDKNGYPNTRAMLKPRKRNGLQELFLTTNTSSGKVKTFKKNNKACLYFCDQRFIRGVMLIGKIEVMEDIYHKKLIWEETDTLYYKEGVTDPDYCVLKFTTAKVSCYHSFKVEEFDI